MRMTATIDSTGAVELDTAGQITRENHSTVGDARRAVMATAKTLAEQTSQDMQLHIEDPSGSRTFLVGADGTSRQESVAPAPATVESSAPVEPDESAEPASVPAVESVVSAPVEPVSAAEPEPVPAVEPVEPASPSDPASPVQRLPPSPASPPLPLPLPLPAPPAPVVTLNWGSPSEQAVSALSAAMSVARTR